MESKVYIQRSMFTDHVFHYTFWLAPAINDSQEVLQLEIELIF